MAYQLDSAKQTFGNQDYLAHKIKGATVADDRYLFAQRVEAYGIIDFGAMARNATKRVALSTLGITSQISLKSAYAFGASATTDEIKYRLFSGTTQLMELQLLAAEMPFVFPPGAIVDPTLSIEILATQAFDRVMLFWQPVHVLDYKLVP